MFDPASNPFAIQNLLEREQPPFVEVRDERPASAFGVDPLAGGSFIKAFEVDRGLLMPDDDFQADQDFSGDFVAEAAMPEPGFAAGEEAESDAAFVEAFNRAMADTEEAVGEGVAAEADNFADGEAVGSEAGEEILAEGDVLSAAVAQQADDETSQAEDSIAERVEPSVVAQAHSEPQNADDTSTESQAAASADHVSEETMPEQEANSEAVAAMASEAELASEPEPEPEPVHAGQAGEAVADSAVSVLDSEAVRQMMDEARAQAYAEGLEAGRQEGREAERPVAHQQGYDEGFAAGAEQGRGESVSKREKQQEKAHREQIDRMEKVVEALQQLSYNADALFEPMKKLAVHLAEQLVRGELQQSPQAISRLVDNALRELNASGDKAVIVHLNPEDLEAYKPTVASFADSIVLRPDAQLERGSVRASLDGSVVEDLMQRRIEGTKKSLAQASAPGWRNAGGRLADRMQQGRPVEDVTVTSQADKVVEVAAPADGHA